VKILIQDRERTCVRGYQDAKENDILMAEMVKIETNLENARKNNEIREGRELQDGLEDSGIEVRDFGRCG
jgi:hypothetical protein